MMGLPQPIDKACREISGDRRLDGDQLARRALVALAELYESSHFENVEELLDESRACSICLAKARSSASVVGNVVAGAYAKIERIAAKSDDPVSAAAQVVSTALGELERSHVDLARQVGRIVGPEKLVMVASPTASVVEGLCRGRAGRVVVLESRPSVAGRSAAIKLSERGISVELVSDAAAPGLVRDVTQLIVGAEVLLADGAAVSLVGAFGPVLAAVDAKVPVSVVAERLKVAPLHATPQERRPDDEIWEDAPAGVEVVNMAYDLIPPSKMTSIITERGKTTPDEVAQLAARRRVTWRKIGLN